MVSSAVQQAVRALRRNLLLQFSLASLLAIAALALTLALLIGRVAAAHVLQEAMHRAAEDVTPRTLRRLTPEDFERPMQGERYAAFSQFMHDTIVSSRTARIKIWDRAGRVIFSTDASQVGQVFPVKPALTQALQGESAGAISVPHDAENALERLLGTISDGGQQGSDRVRRLQRIVRLHEDTATLGPERPVLNLAASTTSPEEPEAMPPAG